LGLLVALLLALGVLAVVARDDERTRHALLAPVTDRQPTTTTTVPTTEPPTTTTVAPAPTTTVPPGPPVAAGDPDGLAIQLAAAMTAVRDPATPEPERARMAHTEQLAYYALVDHPEWRPILVPKLPPALQGPAQANMHAGDELRLLSPAPKDKLPSGWAIDAPRPAAELLGYYKEAQTQTGIPWSYLAAINLVETRMGRIHGLSSAGAQGPMQFMPATWARFGAGDINNPRDAILAAARYLKYNGAPQTVNTAIWNYNRSWHYVDAVMTYADQMRLDERSFAGYHHWQVYYRTVAGNELLPEGWRS
jgi:hypothetical protein